jgi:hypothetical protein
MEGWSPLEGGGQTCLQLAEAAERPPKLADESAGGLPDDPTATLRQPERTQTEASEGQALPDAKVDAGRKTVPVTGEVSLDVLLYGKKNKAPLRSVRNSPPVPASDKYCLMTIL